MTCLSQTRVLLTDMVFDVYRVCTSSRKFRRRSHVRGKCEWMVGEAKIARPWSQVVVDGDMGWFSLIDGFQ